MPVSTEYPIKAFSSQHDWAAWLATHHTDKGVWLRLYKKNSGIPSVSYEEAVEEALCYGWIDGQGKRYDDQSYLQKFVPRGPKSIWSKINTQRVERLAHAGRMKPAGLAAVEAAKKDGRWERAYDSPTTMEIPADFISALNQNPAAKAFFDTLNKTNRYAIAWHLQTAKKPETRATRFSKLLTMLEQGEKFH